MQKKNTLLFSSRWTLILVETIKQVRSYKSLGDLQECKGLWNAIEIPLKICQTAAFLEVQKTICHNSFFVSCNWTFLFQVFHAAFGLVRSNPMIVLIQIISRVFLVWGVANFIPNVRQLYYVF